MEEGLRVEFQGAWVPRKRGDLNRKAGTMGLWIFSQEGTEGLVRWAFASRSCAF